MLKLSLRNLVASRGRLALTILAVLLGTAFISAAGTVGATLSASFGLDDEVQLPDVTVSGESDFGGFEVQPPAISQQTIDAIEALDDVAGSNPNSDTTVVTSRGDRSPLDEGGSDTAVVFVSASIWPRDEVGEPVELASGAAPEAPGDVALDALTVERAGLALGDDLILTSLAYELQGRLVGVVEAEDEGFDVAVPYITFPDAQLLAGRDGADRVEIAAADGVSADELKTSVESVLPPDAVAVTGQEQREEFEAANGSQTRIIQAVLGGFAAVALLVGSFLVGNTFNMVIAQRQRQLAMLRAIGATRRQVRRSVLVEAAVVSLVSSVIGAVIGIGVGWLLISLIGALTGDGLPVTELGVSPLFLGLAVVAGTVIGVVAATVAARRATSIPPVAALAEVGVGDVTPRPERVRLVLGALCVAAAAALMAAAVAGAPNVALLAGGGAVLGVIALIVLNPIIARVLAPAVHRLFPGSGAAPRLARRNTSRNPRRVAGTASAMLIGLTIVVTAMVLSSSVQASLGGQYERALADSDVVVFEGTGVPAPSLGVITALPEVASAAGVGLGSVQIDGEVVRAATVTPDIDALLDADVVTGATPGGLGMDEVAMSTEALERYGLAVGDTVDVTYPAGGTAAWQVTGSYRSTVVLEGFTVSEQTLAASGNQPGYGQVFVAAAGDVAAATAAIDEQLAGGQGRAQTVAERSDALSGTLDTLLTIIFVLLGITLIIALLGVVNTTVLSTLERTREFGMLRAVGTTRRQLRDVVRRETVAITLYGAVTGVLAGLVIGCVVVLSLRDQDVDVLSVPWVRIAVVLLVALVAGVLAAALPARRAARMDVLQALHSA